ncbi:MAG TPA: rhomboid family intramembrane serine protease [Gemmatimonadaceae bacterium]|nr:rhomboid family intramembrane serine protease [Gemmatimonadaceae bacterium]
MATEYQEERRFGVTPAVAWLLAINIGVFFLQLAIFGERNVFGALGFDSVAMPSGWWTMATYMFVHAGLAHLAFNMFALWTFGPRVEREWSTRGFTAFYLWCGLGGALTHLILVRSGVLVGASAAVYGVMLAFAIRWPDEEVFVFGIIPMKTKWFVGWMVVMNLALAMASQRGGSAGSGIAAVAHLGGLAFAWVYIKGPGAGGIERFRRRVAAIPDDPDEMPRPVPKPQPRSRESAVSRTDAVVAKSMATAPKLLPPPVDSRKRRSEELNRVLDKISQSGVQSLSPDERTILERFSRELRGG